ncbi:MAG: patatin-like phospholipase family protein [Acidobacteria bacterium]|nr:patatin-like phospholipase family protein [Acidobacteriota bacterium]
MSERFQILSLDGGGIKARACSLLRCWRRSRMIFNIDITDHFDLIAGTSTGGIVAWG